MGVNIQLRAIRLALCVCGAAVGFSSLAGEISADQARRAVRRWNARSAAVRGVTTDVRTLKDASGAACAHVVGFSDGGFVVTTADDGSEPILAFSTTEVYPEGTDHVMADLLRRAAAVRRPQQTRLSVPTHAAAVDAHWRELLSDEDDREPVHLASNEGLATVFRPCVKPLVKTKWGQDSAGRRLCYNRFTPAIGTGHSPCGCVATAGAQLMKSFAFPTVAMPSKAYLCAISGMPTYLKTSGRAFRWSDMPDSPSSSSADSQLEAIGYLTSDVGIACGSSYFETGTSSNVKNLESALKEAFGYSQAVAFDFYNTSLKPTAENLKRIIIPNLVSSRPLVMGMQGYAGGHAVVVDGYGYDTSYGSEDETIYLHINYGWEGANDLWFLPPSEDALLPGYYYLCDTLLGNVCTVGTGSFLAGRVLRKSSVTGRFEAVQNATVGLYSAGGAKLDETTVDAEGQYAFRVSAGTYRLRARLTSSGKESQFFDAVVRANSRLSVGNALCDIQMDETGAAPRPVIDAAKLKENLLVVTCSDPKATIRYTNDGTDPLPTSPEYVGPIGVNRTCTYRFAAFVPDCSRSAIVIASVTAPSMHPDDFADAARLRGECGTAALVLFNATREEGEPEHAGELSRSSLWLTFTPTSSTDYTFTAHPYNTAYETDIDYYPVTLAVYTGDSLDGLVEIVSNAGEGSCSVSIHAKAGVAYRVAVDLPYQEKDRTCEIIFDWAHGYADTLRIGQRTKVIGSAGGRQEVPIISSAAWQVASCPDWVVPTKKSGQASETLAYTVKANASGVARRSEIVMTCGVGATQTICVYQQSLDWKTTRADAFAAATAAKRKILVTYARPSEEYYVEDLLSFLCQACETPAVRKKLSEQYVLWFCDGDESGAWDGGYYTGNSSWSYDPRFAVVEPTLPLWEMDYSTWSSWSDASELMDFLDGVDKTPVITAVTRIGSDVQVSWKAVPGATAYNIYRATRRSSMDVLATGVKALAYLDRNAPDYNPTYYRVCAVVDGEEVWNGGSVAARYVSPPAQLSIAAALNNDTLDFACYGASMWYGQTAVSHDGKGAMRSGPVGCYDVNNQVKNASTSTLSTCVRGPALLTFWWKASCGEGAMLYCTVDDRLASSLRNGVDTDWSEVEIVIPAGRHHVAWCYDRYVTTIGGEDCGWLDQVSVLDLTGSYLVVFDPNGAEGEMRPQAFKADGVTKLPQNAFGHTGWRFCGWRGENSRLYDPGMLVFGLAREGERFTFWPEWEYPLSTATVNYRIVNGAAVVAGEYSYYPCVPYATTTGRIVVPAKLGGCPVTEVGDAAFYYCESILVVSLPTTVTKIGDYAFYGCKRLRSVIIPPSVTSIGYFAFASCPNLHEIRVAFGDAARVKAMVEASGGRPSIHYIEIGL